MGLIVAVNAKSAVFGRLSAWVGEKHENPLRKTWFFRE